MTYDSSRWRFFRRRRIRHGRSGTASRPRPAAPAAALGLLALLTLTGCASFRALPLPDRAAHSLRTRQERAGLLVAISAHLDRGRVRRHFGPGVWEAGYFPVVVHLENRGSSNLVIERDRFALWLEVDGSGGGGEAGEGGDDGDEGDGGSHAAAGRRPASPRRVVTACHAPTAPAWLLTPLFVAPALWARRGIERYNFELTEDLTRKAFPAYWRIEPGDPPVRGALFFRRPGTEEPLVKALRNAEIRLVARAEGSRVAADAGPDATDEKDATDASGEREHRVGRTVRFILPLTGDEE